MTVQMAAILIPVYKERPDAQEELSLNRCLLILGSHPVIFIAPLTLNMKQYEEACKKQGVPFKEVRFDDFYFSGIAGYNQLMLSAGFYRTFLAYRHILIYQLDAYVFSDQLAYWCGQGYDFIGAPHKPHDNNEGEIQFLKGYSSLLAMINKTISTNLRISNVGNGGFSLRRTKTCYLLLTVLSKKVTAWGTNNEDGFFKYWGNLLRPLFRLPSDETALHFAIEQTPAASLEQLGNRLPFGCHAFGKYEPEIWRKYIHSSPEQSKITRN
jgi:hypothetical protein